MGKRLNYIDSAKGIAVLLVIFGHTFRESMRADYFWCDFSYLFVYRFHVSLLFLLSGTGYALSKNKYMHMNTFFYIKKKAKSLIFPWLSYSFVIYAVFALLWCVPPVKAILSGSAYKFIFPLEFLGKLLKNENPYCFHIWYLQTLFFFCVSTCAADKLLSERTAKIIKITVIAASPVCYELFCTALPWAIKGFVQKIPFFLLGTLLSEGFISKNAKKLSLAAVPCVMFEAGFILFSQFNGMYENAFLNTAAIYIENAAICGISFGIAGVCALFEKRTELLARFGSNTMPYYLYHQPFCCAFLGIVLYEKMHLSAILTVALCMAASISIPYAVIKIARKTGIDVLLKKIGLPT